MKIRRAAEILAECHGAILEHVIPCLSVLQWLEESSTHDPAGRSLQLRRMGGFFVRVDGDVCFATAGHALVEKSERVDQGMVVHVPRLVAGMQPDGTNTQFTLEDGTYGMRAWYDPDTGVDYGLVTFDESVATEIEGAGAKVIDEDEFPDYGEDLDPLGYDVLCAVGFPDQLRTQTLKHDQRSISAIYVPAIAGLVPADPEALPIEVARHAKEWPRIFARLLAAEYTQESVPDPVVIQHWAGISGSPCFGIRAGDGYIDFELLGIQSSTLPQSGYLIAGFATPLLDLIGHEGGMGEI